MRTLTAALALGLVLVITTGCEETVDPILPTIDATVALDAAQAVLMLASLGVEVGAVSDDPDFSFEACPALEEAGDELLMNYGAGCEPGSAVTIEPISGLLTLVSPATNDIAYGVTTAFGFGDLPVAGEFTLATQRTGDTLQVDFDIESLAWTASGNDNSLTGLFTLAVRPSATTVSLSRATMRRGEDPPISIEAEGVTVAGGGFGVCPHPSDGRLDLESDNEEAIVLFDEATADDGSFAVTLNDGIQGRATLDCQPEAPDETDE